MMVLEYYDKESEDIDEIKMTDLEQYCRFVEVRKNVFRLDKNPDFFAVPQIEDPLELDLRIKAVYDSASKIHRLVNSRDRFEEDFIEPACKIQNFYDLHSLFLALIGNAEIHGNKFDPRKQTEVAYTFKKTKKAALLELCVRDEGDGFDYRHLLQMEKEARGTTQGYNSFRDQVPEYSVGHGLFGIIRYADVVRWNERGNEITMLKVLIRP